MFGARGTGKSSLLRRTMANALWIDLLSAKEELRFADNPDVLAEIVRAQRPRAVVIDEVQKVPRLLDVVHQLIEERGTHFALSGSSARKLKRNSANMLGGRALVSHLYPFTHRELGKEFALASALEFGTLPIILSHGEPEHMRQALEAYVETYLKEEVVAEQLVRNLIPFRKFLPLVAQNNGGIINYREIAKAVKADDNTVKNYFEILEDTLVGFKLPAYERSLRKQQIKSPKFYLFDVGVTRALHPLVHDGPMSSQECGPAFEHFVITELHRLRSYLRKRLQFYFLNTGSEYEIDLVVESAGAKVQFVEIKYSEQIGDEHLRGLRLARKALPGAECVCLCREPFARTHDGIDILPWQQGIARVLGE